MDERVLFLAIQEWLQQELNLLLLLQRVLLAVREIFAAEEMDPMQYCLLNQEQQLIRILLGGQWDMRRHIRVSEEAFDDLLRMISQNSRSGWEQKLKLAVFLFWLASGASFRIVSSSFGMPRSSVHRMVHQMMRQVLSLSGRVIKIPSNGELEAIGAGFARMSRSEELRCAVGAIDGCHVEVIASGRNRADYFNRRLRYSIQFQAVCDHQGKFVDVFAGYPGSVHDSRVFRASPLFLNAVYPPEGFVILGDSGYPCISEPIAVLTPYREPVAGPVQARFNAHHRRGRNVVERSFGMLKTRWRCIFMQRVTLRHTRVANVIGACCIMHNICMTNGDVLVAEEEAGEAENVVGVVGHQENGFHIRDQIAQRMSRPVNVPAHLIEHNYF